MSRHDVEQLLDRYLIGDTSSFENSLVEKWLSENKPENTDWERLDMTGRKRWVSHLFSDIQATIVQSGKSKPTHLKLWKTIATVAATVTVFMMLFFLWPIIQGNKATLKLTTLSVPVNQQKKITLADGSKVWINSSSELNYPIKFNADSREVYLSGEAYFDIQHDSSKPFIVHTGKITTTVLGTAFNINADKNTSTIVVTVTRGKVSVANETKLLAYISPNQQLTYNLKDDRQNKIIVNAKSVIAWQDDLYFNDITFGYAVNLLQQRFKISIEFSNNKIKDCRFSGTALKGNNLNQILEVICAFNQATYHYNLDGSITIDGKGCN